MSSESHFNISQNSFHTAPSTGLNTPSSLTGTKHAVAIAHKMHELRQTPDALPANVRAYNSTGSAPRLNDAKLGWKTNFLRKVGIGIGMTGIGAPVEWLLTRTATKLTNDSAKMEKFSRDNKTAIKLFGKIIVQVVKGNTGKASELTADLKLYVKSRLQDAEYSQRDLNRLNLEAKKQLPRTSQTRANSETNPRHSNRSLNIYDGEPEQSELDESSSSFDSNVSNNRSGSSSLEEPVGSQVSPSPTNPTVDELFDDLIKELPEGVQGGNPQPVSQNISLDSSNDDIENIEGNIERKDESSELELSVTHEVSDLESSFLQDFEKDVEGIMKTNDKLSTLFERIKSITDNDTINQEIQRVLPKESHNETAIQTLYNACKGNFKSMQGIEEDKGLLNEETKEIFTETFKQTAIYNYSRSAYLYYSQTLETLREFHSSRILEELDNPDPSSAPQKMGSDDFENIQEDIQALKQNPEINQTSHLIQKSIEQLELLAKKLKEL